MPSARRIIGVDESGKGDFFGPLVIAGLLAGENDVPELRAIGVRDSKKISDNKLLPLDEVLRSKFPHSVIVVQPEEYNRRYTKIRNLNKLLAWGHVRAIETILAKHRADSAVSDKFGKSERIDEALRQRSQTIQVKQIVRGESIAQVAAASILARAAFIREMTTLTEKWGIELPKGASALVDKAGRELVAIHGIEMLPSVAKTHFKNYLRVTNPRLPV